MKKVFLLSNAILMTFLISAQNNWNQRADFGGATRYAGIGFSISDYGFIGTGYNIGTGISYKDFWKYNPYNDTWTQIADFGGIARWSTISFVINGKGYVGNGLTTGGYVKDFWRYDTLQNSWTQIANFGGPARGLSIGFAINGKGYCGTGYSSVYRSDIWEYDPLSDVWTQKNDFGGGGVQAMSVFVINDKAYACGGENGNVNRNTVWEYNQALDSWTQKSNFQFAARHSGVAFSIGDYGYYGTGRDGTTSNLYDDLWQYNPCNDTWVQVAQFPGQARAYAAAFSINQNGFIGIGGLPYSFYTNDFWEFTPPINPSPTITTNGSTTFCQGDSVALTVSSGISYLWNNGDTTQSITVFTSGSYIVTVTFTNGCSQTSAPVYVTVNSSPSIPTIIQNGSMLACSESGMSSYEWFLNGNVLSSCSTQFCTCQQNGFYSVTITNNSLCSSSSGIFNANGCNVGIIENFIIDPIRIHPNPAANKIIIFPSFLSATLFNTKGQILFISENKIPTNTLDVSNLTNGIYFVEINTGDKKIITKLIIIK